MNYSNSFTILFILAIASCSPQPRPIEYDTDQCHACKMRISDQRFGAELVTTKGKVYKFDAAECLIPEVLKNGEDSYSHILVSDYSQPGKLINALTAHYRITKSIPSPMGAFLSAYVEKSPLQHTPDENTGFITWEQLKREDLFTY